jgi:hypothetical protein
VVFVIPGAIAWPRSWARVAYSSWVDCKPVNKGWHALAEHTLVTMYHMWMRNGSLLEIDYSDLAVTTNLGPTQKATSGPEAD